MILFRRIARWKERFGAGRAFLYFLLFFFFIGAMISVSEDRQERQVYVDGTTYVYRGWEEDRYVFETEEGQPFYALPGEDRSENGRFHEVTIRSEGLALRREYDAENAAYSVYRSGDFVDRYPVTAKRTDTVEGRLVMELTRKIDERGDEGLFLSLVFNLIFTAVGSAYLFFPETFWHLSRDLHEKGGKPTPFFYFTHAVGGLGFLCLGVGFALIT